MHETQAHEAALDEADPPRGLAAICSGNWEVTAAWEGTDSTFTNRMHTGQDEAQ